MFVQEVPTINKGEVPWGEPGIMMQITFFGEDVVIKVH